MHRLRTRLRPAAVLVAVCTAVLVSSAAQASQDRPERDRGRARAPAAAAVTAAPVTASPTTAQEPPSLEGRWRRSDDDKRGKGRESYASEAGSTWTMRFRGGGLDLVGTLAPHHGQATVQIDDGPVTTVDQYASSRQPDTVFFRSPALDDGEHVAVVTVLGKRQKAASDTVVSIGPATVRPAVPVQLVTSDLNDTVTTGADGTFTYDGDWSTSTGGRGKFDGDDHYSSRPGDTATVRFDGVRIALYGSQAPHHGRALVSIDGGEPTPIDQYASARVDSTAFFESPVLADGPHTAVVTVLPTRRSAGKVVSIDRAQITRVAAAPEPSASGAAWVTAWDALGGTSGWGETADGRTTRAYASVASNGDHPVWHVEPSSSAVDQVDGRLVKRDTEQFHRMFSKQRFGGPGKTVTIAYRGRATAIRDRSGSSVVGGAKVGLKWPVQPQTTGYSKDDPRSVYGQSPQNEKSPGSYQFLTGLTEGGYMELSRNGYGDDGYDFFHNTSVGYTPGTWKDVVIKVDWQADRSMRVRYWHNRDARGTPVYEALDAESPFWSEPAFLWLRSDDTDFEYDSLTVRECAAGC